MNLRQLPKKRTLILTFIAIAFQIIAIGQVTINEYSASFVLVFVDSVPVTEDWVELYNSGTEEVDLSGWHLSDKEDNPSKWKFPEGTVIAPEGFLTVYCSGRNEEYLNQYHTNFKLSQTTGKDYIVLSDADENILESYKLSITMLNHSNCRGTDGSNEWKVCTKPTLNVSNNTVSQKYRRYTKAPTINLSAGYYNGSQTVSVNNNEENSILRYTLDGTNPTESSPEYAGLISIDQTTVVKVRSFSNDSEILTGKMDFSTFFINEEFSVPVFSVAADQVIELANGIEYRPIGSIEYFNLDKEREATSYGSLDRHGKDSWKLDHRSLDWISRDEMGYSKAVKAKLFSYSERDEYQKFMFRNSGDDNYPAIDDGYHEGSTHIRDEFVQTLALEGGMKLDQRALQHVVLFLNGEYWGLYGMREKAVDHDYTKEYYNQDKFNIQYLSTWSFTVSQYGGSKARDDWEGIRDFILDNDMGVDMNYDVVEDSINLLSLIDYMIVNLNVVASDWLNFNTAWWRGLHPDGDHKKWGYILWDMDATFDYYFNFSGVPNTQADAVPCDLEEIAIFIDGSFGSFGNVGSHAKIFLKLLDENETFKQLYYSRYADMMNTVFTCENMISTLDRLLNVTRPEMPKQIERWGGSMTEWESNVQKLKDFINQRCTLLDDGMIECYEELNGPYQITLMTEPDGIGEIDFNTLDIESFPWTGDYFGGMENKIKAKVFKDFEDEYKFSHWISTSGNPISPDMQSRKANISISQPDTLIAVFKQIGVGTQELGDEYAFSLYPNPVMDNLLFEYNLESSANVNLSLHTILGGKVISFEDNNSYKSRGKHAENLDISIVDLKSGLYIFVAEIDDKQRSFKINILR